MNVTPVLLVFMSVALELSFFMAWPLASVGFHTLIFSFVLVCLKLNRK